MDQDSFYLLTLSRSLIQFQKQSSLECTQQSVMTTVFKFSSQSIFH